MKITTLWLAILLVSLTGCVTSTPNRHSSPAPPKKLDPPESVIVYYYVKPGQEGALEDTLARAWALYQKENMVAAQPHLVVKETENQGNGDLMTRYIEIFTWLSHAKPAHAPESVSKIWQEMQSLCLPHNGRQGPYGGEVEVVNPAVHPAKP